MWNSTLQKTQYHSSNIFLQMLVTFKTSNTHLGPFMTLATNSNEILKIYLIFFLIETLTILPALE